MTETLYTAQEAAKILKVTTRTIYTYIKAKELKAGKIGHKWMISESALNEFISRQLGC
jgi:excisionase family DNA binding protein